MAIRSSSPKTPCAIGNQRRWQGEVKYAALEQKLATAPSISVPTVTLKGDANAAPHPAPENYTKRLTGKYQFPRVI